MLIRHIMNELRVNQMRSETIDQPAGQRAGLVMWLAMAMLAMLAGMSVTTANADDGAAAPVGTVSLVLGKAWVESADGDRETARTGTEILATDRVVTTGTGHVHIRFIDDALVSVRPDSRLRITDYVYDADAPAESLVRFTLEEGVTRSISGEAGRNARDRFRLDTPIAAIGVRGTDFVVSAGSDNMRALVNEGAIVVAPYSESCVAGGLGPCVSEGVELAGASMQVVELAEGQMQPMLRPLADSRMYAVVDGGLAEREEGEDESRESTTSEAKNELPEGYRESVAIREVNEQAEDDNAAGGSDSSGNVEIVATSIAPEDLAERQLVWGRFTGSNDDPGISLAWADVREERNVTVGNGEFGLYRTEDGVGRVDEALAGEIGFQLNAAQAIHESDAGVEAVAVRNGDLRIDFSRGTFSTGLDLDSEATGAFRFNSSGELLPTGIFRERRDDGTVAGAVSLDGSEAGYFFDRRIGGGVVRGATLWGADE